MYLYSSVRPAWLCPALLGLTLLVFTLLKWPDLSLPLFWDELGVYGPGILHMFDQGPGLLPSALPPELSRGHPLLFYFLFAATLSVTGYSLTKLHLIALACTWLLVGAVYRVVARLQGPAAGLLAGLLLLVQPCMYALSGLALPEILLSFFLLQALYTFAERRYGWYLLWADLALLTKESALVMITATFLWGLVMEGKSRYQAVGLALAPLIVYAAFLLVQKVQNGWFFFPYHLGLISFDLHELIPKLRLSTDFLWSFQARWTWIISLLGLLVGLAWVGRKQGKWPAWRFLLLSLLFYGGMWMFSLINPYMDRYLTVMVTLQAVWLGTLGGFLFRAVSRPVQAGLTAAATLLLVLPFFFFSNTHFRYDVNPNYRALLKLQQRATTYLAERVEADEPFHASFPLYHGFQDPRSGFIAGSKRLNPVYSPQEGLRYAAIFKPPTHIQSSPYPEANMILREQESYADVAIYYFPPADSMGAE